MKKVTLLLIFILTSTLGFSQTEDNVTTPTSETNYNKEALTNEIDKLELEYIMLKTKALHTDFAKEDIEQKKGDNAEAYLNYLKNKISELKAPKKQYAPLKIIPLNGSTGLKEQSQPSDANTKDIH